jgi:hypothetical protein
MKKSIACLFVLAALCASTAWAHDMGKMGGAKGASAAPKQVSIKGEIVDTGCYLGHGAKGEKHKGCATKCISGGMPMGLLTADGTLYLLTLDHDNPDPYNQAKDLAAEMVEVSGTLLSRSGMKAIDVTGIKPVATAAAK